MESEHQASSLTEALPIFQGQDFEQVLTQLGWPVGVNTDQPVEFRRRLCAAAISYQMMNKSIDYTLKRYLQDYSCRESPHSRLDKKIARVTNVTFDVLSEKLDELTDRETEHLGEVISEWTFYRIPFSYELVLTCAQRGALFECLAIVRMILEQIAWAMEIRKFGDADAIQRTSSTKSVRNLKSIYPSVGEFYGWLSNHAHWAYDAHIKALDRSSEKLAMRLANSLYKAQALGAALVLTDVAKAAYGKLFAELGFSDSLDTHLQSKLFVKQVEPISELMESILELAPEDSDLLQLCQMLPHKKS